MKLIKIATHFRILKKNRMALIWNKRWRYVMVTCQSWIIRDNMFRENPFLGILTCLFIKLLIYDSCVAQLPYNTSSLLYVHVVRLNSSQIFWKSIFRPCRSFDMEIVLLTAIARFLIQARTSRTGRTDSALWP